MAAVDLPENVAVQLMAESATNTQHNNNNQRNVSTVANNVIQVASARNFDKLGAVESRAVSGVLATPVAPPTTGE